MYLERAHPAFLTTKVVLVNSKNSTHTQHTTRSISLVRSEMTDTGTRGSVDTRPSGQRSNSSVHVCWHRATSVAIMDHQKALENQLSGYLLRKFKNSNGWQKLWVVFTNFCLYFYKTFQDDFPLASLPLLGKQQTRTNI